MKKLYKEITVIPAGGTVTLKANDLNNYYMITGNAVTLTAGFTITIDAASKNNTVKIYWNQPVTIGVGGAVTILGNTVTEYDVLEDLIIDCSYDGTVWKNIYTQNLSVSTLTKPIWSNTVTVNYDLLNNDSTRRIFKTYAEAITYINTQTPLATDHWAVFLPSGLCDEDMILYSNIDIQGTAGTMIKSVVSSIASTGSNFMDGLIRNCTINKVNVAQAKTMCLMGCTIITQAPVPAAADGYVEMMDCLVLGGDFSNTVSVTYWRNCEIRSVTPITSLEVDLVSCDIAISNALTWAANPHWRGSTVVITTLNVTNGCKITNCYFKAFTMNVTGSNAVFYNSEVTGNKIITNAATLDLHNSESNGGDITLDNTAELNLYGINEIDGTVTFNGASTQNDYSGYYDNTSSGLVADTVKEAIDELAGKVLPLRLVFASLDAPDSTTIVANGTYYPIEGTFTNSPLERFAAATVHVPGIKYTDAKTMYFEVDWHATVSANIAATTVSVGIKKNNVLLPASVMSAYLKTGGEAGNMSGTVIVSLAQNDEIQLAVTSDGDGDVITFNNFTTSIISIIN